MNNSLSKLKVELKQSIANHYKRLISQIPDIYGYALYTTDDIPGLGPVANRESALTVDPSDKMYNYYRYLAVEWSEWDDFGLFTSVNEIVKELRAAEDIPFAARREAVLRLCLNVLCELDAEGVFGQKTDQRFIVLCIADSDDVIMMESARLLNTVNAFNAYATQF